MLQYDGLYMSGPHQYEEVRYYDYARFYEDGTVLIVAARGQPKHVIRWFDTSKPDLPRGTYQIQDDRIVFATTAEEGTIDYDGQLTPEGLQLHSLRHTQDEEGNEEQKQYTFIPEPACWFSPRTLEILHKAGWSAERRISTERYDQILQQEGYPIFAVQKEFLSRFGGLKANIPLTPEQEERYGRRSFHFDVAEAAKSMGAFPDSMEYYSEKIGAPLSIIGEDMKPSEEFLLTITSEGKIYRSYEDYIGLVGDSWQEAIDEICTLGGNVQ